MGLFEVHLIFLRRKNVKKNVTRHFLSADAFVVNIKTFEEHFMFFAGKDGKNVCGFSLKPLFFSSSEESAGHMRVMAGCCIVKLATAAVYAKLVTVDQLLLIASLVHVSTC